MRTRRKPSISRVVSYRLCGDIDCDRAMRLLSHARDRGVVTQFDGTKSMERGMDVVWFEGPPGAALRGLRRALSMLVVTP